ncbi:hypothetical protein BDP27DRAFT_1372395 [Rhodocollybia butyracea]|uniref:Ribonuclease H1 N-terminal domain-containing protein n=1 Tax=Rhodocollybia butyracea TaxID=206335 RepID=A0A9P5PA88_9AGAR|nr:hypothetical protein BDP27DRAFT_1372395 [Rhodocollybia butyracea]
MTGTQTNISPLKGTPEGRRLRNLEIVKALNDSNPPHRKVKTSNGSNSIVWISSGEEDEGEVIKGSDTEEEDLVAKMEELSVKRLDTQQTNATPVFYGNHSTSSNPFLSSQPMATPPRYSTIATPPQTPVRHGSSHTAANGQGSAAPAIHPVSPAPAPVAAAPATPGRQGKFSAYVVYSGKTPHFYANWSTVKRMLEGDPTLVFKGFYSLEKAREAWQAARDSGVINAIRNGAGRPYWSVTEGVRPAVYDSIYEAVKVGLEWGGGNLKGWNTEADAEEDWNDKANTHPSRIMETPSPNLIP